MTMTKLFERIEYEGYTLEELEAAAGGGGGGGSKNSKDWRSSVGSIVAPGVEGAYSMTEKVLNGESLDSQDFLDQGRDVLVPGSRDATDTLMNIVGGEEVETPKNPNTTTNIGGNTAPGGDIPTFDEEEEKKKKVSKARKGTRGLQIPKTKKATVPLVAEGTAPVTTTAAKSGVQI